MDGSATIMQSYAQVMEVHATKVKLVYEVSGLYFCMANSL
jgi:hypothetical protein